jgi:hypothetical protein
LRLARVAVADNRKVANLVGRINFHRWKKSILSEGFDSAEKKRSALG